MRQQGFRTAVMVALVTGIGVFAAPAAAAYVDPGSGSYIFQMLIAGLLGASLAVKAFWARIRAFVGGLFRRKGEEARSVEPSSSAEAAREPRN